MNCDFEEIMRGVLGDQAPALFRAIESGVLPVSIRTNPVKAFVEPTAARVPWSRWGCYLAERPQFTLDPHFQAGAYYVQEASSMFVEHLVRQAAGSLDGKRILDLCAAPGGKSTIYASLAPHGIVVANEVVRQRAMVLADNLRRWGMGNTVVTSNDPSHFGALAEWFDIVAVDAPCSGEGMFRKSGEARSGWSVDNVKLCAARQRRILSDIWGSLAEGGLLIYSTCTYNPTEDEANVGWLCDTFDCERVHIDVPDEWNIVRSEAGCAECFHFYPHLVEGEGFFAAVVRKAGDCRRNDRAPKPRKNPLSDVDRKSAIEAAKWVSGAKHFATAGNTVYAYDESLWNDFRTVSEQLSVVTSGIETGEFFGGRLRPSHWLALAADLRADGVPTHDVPLDEALRFLRREELHDISALDEGLNLLCFEHQPIGFTKRIGNRTNSSLPKELRILK